MRRTWEWLGLNLGRHAGVVACVGLAVTLLLGIGLTMVQFSTGDSDYLNGNDPAAIGNQEYTSLFGGDPSRSSSPCSTAPRWTTCSLQPTRRRCSASTAALSRIPSVYDVVSPLTALQFSSILQRGSDLSTQMFISAYQRDKSARSRAIRQAYAVAEARGLSQFTPAQEVMSNPKWVHFILHEPNGALRSSVTAFVPDEHHVLMAILLKPNLSFNQELAAAAQVQAVTQSAHYQNASTITTGVPEIEKDISDYLRTTLKTLIPLAAGLMALILLLTFRVRWRLLPFAILGIGMIWAFGLVGYFGVPLTFATLTALPVLMGVGMDYSIQMHTRIEEEVVLNRSAHPIQAAARGLGPALLIVTFDAVFAFMALWFSKVPAVRQFGSLMIIGIIAVCLCSLMLTLSVLGIREYRSPTRVENRSPGALSGLVVRLSGLSPRVAIPAMALAAAVFVAGVATEGKLVVQPDPIQWLNPNSTAVKQITMLERVTGSDNQIGVVVKTNSPFSAKTVDYITRLTEVEAHHYGTILYPGAGLVSSSVDFLSVPGADVVPPTASQIKAFYEALPEALKKELVSQDGRALNVIFLSRTNDFAALEPMIQNLDSDAPPPERDHGAPRRHRSGGVGLLENLARPTRS